MKQVVVGSAPFFPPLKDGERIIAVVEGVSIRRVKLIIGRAEEIISFCGHRATAEFLKVAYCREAATAQYFVPGVVWVGIRPIERPMPGEELPIDIGEFVGWKMTFR
jgi:hypothetical protein